MTKNTQIDHIMPCAGSSGSKAKTDPMATQNQTAPQPLADLRYLRKQMAWTRGGASDG